VQQHIEEIASKTASDRLKALAQNGLLATLLALVVLLTSGLANAQVQQPDPTKGLAAALSASQDSFWDKVIIAAVGPIVGSLLIGGLVSIVADRIQRRRLDAELREKLLVEMTQAAGALYFQTQRYWRTTGPNSPVKLALTPEQVLQIRLSLDECYQSARIAGQALEARLQILFEDDTTVRVVAKEKEWTTNVPWRLWHATMDLLTVRYFQVIDGATTKLLEINAGPNHSLISVELLEQPTALLGAYHERLLQATRAVMTYPRASGQY
jgi:hypothetical protein